MPERKTPQVRFKGFTDTWEQRKLGDCFSLLQNNTLSRAELSNGNGVAMNVHYGDVLIKFDECLDVSKEQLPFIEKHSVADKLKTSYLQNGDVIVADTAEDETVGKCTEIMGVTDQKVISGLHTIPLRPNGKFATGYLGFYLNSAAYHDQLKPLMQGIKVTSISKSAMQDTVIRYPSDIKEQELIGWYFINLDNLITLHQRECERLQMVKKSMLENCFPKNGEKVPRFRFAGFTGDWEQRKLGELGKARSGIGFPEDEQGGKEGIPFYKVSDMNNAGNEHEMTTANNYVTREQIARKGWNPIDEVPAIFFAKVGAAVLLNRKRLCCSPFLLDNNTMAYSIDRLVLDAGFAKTLFETIDLTSLVQVGALPSYNSGDVENLDVVIPKIDEQRVIGVYFKNIDHLITLHQRKEYGLKTYENRSIHYGTF